MVSHSTGTPSGLEGLVVPPSVSPGSSSPSSQPPIVLPVINPYRPNTNL